MTKLLNIEEEKLKKIVKKAILSPYHFYFEQLIIKNANTQLKNDDLICYCAELVNRIVDLGDVEASYAKQLKESLLMAPHTSNLRGIPRN